MPRYFFHLAGRSKSLLHLLCEQELLPKRQLPEMVVDVPQITSEANNPRSRLRRSHASIMRDVPSTRPIENPVLLSESFDSRTLAEMAIALERACAKVAGGKKHRARRHIAARIAQCARSGKRSIAALIRAGEIAAGELRKSS
jgi:hypothetical protein